MFKNKKIWGYLNNIFLNDKCKVDILYLEKNTVCSVHHHNQKINRFYLIKGSVKIKTDLGEYILKEEQEIDVFPPLTHQFIALDDSILVEIAFVSSGKLKEIDIVRKVQGGKIINDKFYTLDELSKENWQ